MNNNILHHPHICMLTEVTVLQIKTHPHTNNGKPTSKEKVMHLTEIHFDHESKGRSHIEVIDVFKNVYLTKTAHTLLKKYLLI